MVDCLENNPEIDDVEIPPILYISGLERTGTTFLHNLLSLHPRSRALLRWELMHPTPPPEAATYRRDPRIAKTQASIDKLRGTLLERMHWVNADEPEECQWGLIDGSSIMGRSACVSMPTWHRWACTRDPQAAFLEYRQLVKLLLWRNPPPVEGHLVLKCPQFSGDLAPLARAFPEARFLLTHRDPYRAIVSICALQASIHDPYFSDRAVLHESSLLPEFFTSFAEDRLVRLFRFCEAHPGVSHVAYPALVKTPLVTVRRIYEETRTDVPDDLEERVEGFILAQRTGKRAQPPESLPSYGLGHDQFLNRPVIADYCRRFAIERETIRRTGTS